MFYTGEYVQSRFCGLGEVITSGDDPIVRFLDGRECAESGDALTIVPDEAFAAELENRLMVERWLAYQVYGSIEPSRPLLRARHFDLAQAMVESSSPFGRQRSGALDEVSCFILDDLAPAAEVRTPWP